MDNLGCLPSAETNLEAREQRDRASLLSISRRGGPNSVEPVEADVAHPRGGAAEKVQPAGPRVRISMPRPLGAGWSLPHEDTNYSSALFVSERHHGIDASCSPDRQVRGKQCGGQEQEGDAKHGDAIGSASPKERTCRYTLKSIWTRSHGSSTNGPVRRWSLKLPRNDSRLVLHRPVEPAGTAGSEARLAVEASPAARGSADPGALSSPAGLSSSVGLRSRRLTGKGDARASCGSMDECWFDTAKRLPIG